MSNETSILTGLSLKMDLFGEQLGELRRELKEVNERQIRLEAQNFDAEVKMLEARLVLLEADYNRRSGAVRLGELLPKLSGWLVAAFYFLYMHFRNQ